MSTLSQGSIAVYYDPHDEIETELAEALQAARTTFRAACEREELVGAAVVLAFDATRLPDLETLDGAFWLYLPFLDRAARPTSFTGVEGVFAASDKMFSWLKRTFPDLHVERAGLPCHPEFRIKDDTRELRQILGVNDSAMAIFCREDSSRLSRIMHRIDDDPRFTLVTMEEMRQIDEQNDCRAAAHAIGGCDLVVGDPTFHRIAEAAASATPMLAFTHPGDPSFGNALHLLEEGAGLIAMDESDLFYHLDRISTDESRLPLLRDNMRRLFPSVRACDQIATVLEQALEQSRVG
ncbi:hypothetical protein KQI84_10060 [bacterium]|nr:hypothetical protein [bacterium]